MHAYLASLEQRIKNKKLRSILFNKYYTIVGLYWCLFYTFWFSVFIGIGNALFSGREFFALFLEGFLNNIPLSFLVNLVYARVAIHLSTLKYPQFYGQLLNLFVQCMFFLWHSFVGTQNPLQAILPPAIIGVVLTYYHINKMLRNRRYQ